MRMIAEEAGVSSNTIYLYDKSKEKIVWEYCHILKYKIPEFLEYLVQQKD